MKKKATFNKHKQQVVLINCWLFRAKGMKSVDRVTNEIVATQGQGNT